MLSFQCATSQNDSIRNFFLGHSLINTQIPQMVHELAKAANHKTSFKSNIGNGANLSWHWTSPFTGQGESWKTALPTRSFDNFILTEAVPLKGHLQWSRTYDYLDSFYLYAAKKSPKVKMLFYETWHCTDSGTPQKCEWDPESNIDWRKRLNTDTSLWQGIVNQFKIKHPQTEIVMVPGGQALGRLHDAINLGELPGYTSHKQMFSDNIHLTSIGNYYIACVMYATIYAKSPVGLPHQLRDMYGQVYALTPSASQAAVLQRLAWETVCAYKYTGIECSVSSSLEIDTKPEIYPTFATNMIILKEAPVAAKIFIYNIQGQKLKSEISNYINHEIFVGDLNPGIYFLNVGKSTFKFVKI